MSSPFLAPHRDPARLGRIKSGSDYYVLPGVAHAGNSSLALVANTDYYNALYVDAEIVVDQLACQVSSGSGTNLRIGLYRADRDWQPTGAPLADSGNLDAATPAIKTYTPATPLVLRRGRYLGVVNADSTPTLIGLTGGPVGGSGAGSTLQTYATRWRIARAYSAFPTPGTAWTTTTDGTTPLLNLVFLRVLRP